MNTDFLKDNWKNLGVVIGKETYPLKEKYMMCWGYDPNIKDALLFDVGGEQGAEANLLSVGAGDSFISHDPTDPTKSRVIGELVSLSQHGIAIIGAVYRHYKGNNYKILRVAKHTENEFDLVIYVNVEDPSKVWARPYHMFFEEVNGKPRFELQK